MEHMHVVNAYILSPDSQKVLVVHNVGGAWSLPGGGVEMGEYLDEAVAREVDEEVSLAVQIDRLVSVAEAPSRDDKWITFFTFLAYQTDLSQTPIITRPDEISSYAWVPVVDLHTYLPYLPMTAPELLDRAVPLIFRTEVR